MRPFLRMRLLKTALLILWMAIAHALTLRITTEGPGWHAAVLTLWVFLPALCARLSVRQLGFCAGAVAATALLCPFHHFQVVPALVGLLAGSYAVFVLHAVRCRTRHRSLSDSAFLTALLGVLWIILTPGRSGETPRRLAQIQEFAFVTFGLGIAASGLCVTAIAMWTGSIRGPAQSDACPTPAMRTLPGGRI